MSNKLEVTGIGNMVFEMQAYRDKLNDKVGVLAFTFSIALLSLPNFTTALIFSIVAMSLCWYICCRCGKNLETKKRLLKDCGRTVEIEKAISLTEIKSTKDVECTVYMIGYLTLTAVCFWHISMVVSYFGLPTLEPWWPAVMSLHESVADKIGYPAY